MSGLYGQLRTRGWFCGPEQSPTHLLLDGGKLRVPDDAAGEFLNAYATALVRDAGTSRRPCIVEVRTPAFRLFLDLDARSSDAEFWTPSALGRLGAAIDATVRECFALGDAVTTICGAPAKALSDGLHKVGLHVHLPDIVVTSSTALAFRARLLGRLADGWADSGLADSWDKTVDAAVYTSSGLRMAWSGKGASESRHYAPLGVYTAAGFVAAEAFVPTVSAYREWVRRLSIRSPDGIETPLRPEMEATVAATTTERAAVSVRGVSMAAYDSDILKMLDDALPPVFMGQRFSGIVATSTSFLLRSTARYCYNLNPPRGHHNNNVYFVLTREGISQRCYCRCETIEGRRGVTCRDFESDTWKVPQAAIDAFFGAAPPVLPPPLPSKRSCVDIGSITAQAESRKKARPRKKASRS
jgi:hypothetical protein